MLLLGAGCATARPAARPATFPGAIFSETLDLHGRGLTAVPAEVFSDTQAVRLDVSDNRLTGALPSEIGKLTRLKELKADHNRFTGIPAEIGRLSQLATIDFSYNSLTGLPHELGELSALRVLDLRGNDIARVDLAYLRERLPQTEILVDLPGAQGKPFGSVVRLGLNQTVTYSDGLKVTLIDIGDSRCPAGVQCVWAGELSPEFRLSGGRFGAERTVILGTVRSPRQQEGDYLLEISAVTESTAELTISVAEAKTK